MPVENMNSESFEERETPKNIADALNKLGLKTQETPKKKETQIQEGILVQKDLDQFSLSFDKDPTSLKSFQNIFLQGSIHNPQALNILGTQNS